jgi:hypothetical protein
MKISAGFWVSVFVALVYAPMLFVIYVLSLPFQWLLRDE